MGDLINSSLIQIGVLFSMPTEQAEKFIQWANRLYAPGSNIISSAVRNSLIERYADTPESRVTLAQSYLDPAQQRMQALISGDAGPVRALCSSIEVFISCFPEEERFSEPLLLLRETLIELYARLSPRYELVDSSEVSSTEYFQGIREDPRYEGPRTSRYARIPVI